MQAPHDPIYEGFHPRGAHVLEPLGLCEPLPRLELSPRKVRAFLYASNWYRLCSVVGVCHLAANNSIAITPVVNLVRALTAWDTSLWELIKAAERGKALTRVLNCREGFTPKDDILPKRLHEAFTGGPLKDVRIDPGEFARALRLYHQMEGWDLQTGWPTFAKLAELGIDWQNRNYSAINVALSRMPTRPGSVCSRRRRVGHYFWRSCRVSRWRYRRSCSKRSKTSASGGWEVGRRYRWTCG